MKVSKCSAGRFNSTLLSVFLFTSLTGAPAAVNTLLKKPVRKQYLVTGSTALQA